MAFSSYFFPSFGGGGAPPITGGQRGIGSGMSMNLSTPQLTPAPLPGGNTSASSIGTGFGRTGPDFSGVSVDKQLSLIGDIGRLTYNPEGGGYRFGDANYKGNPSSGFTDPNANRLASQAYGFIGNLPTRNYGSLALERLYQSTGQKPVQGPSFSSKLGQPYQGPFTMPGYDPFKQYR